MEIREARLDLVCDARYTERITVMVPQTVPGQARAAVINVPKQVSKDYKKTYVHSLVVFMTDTNLAPGTHQYRARLDIGPEPPAIGRQPTVKWTLVTAIDVARSRDVKKRRRVKVSVD